MRPPPIALMSFRSCYTAEKTRLYGRALANKATSKPAVGALLVHQQAWKQSGLALGNLMQSVCLAPGEVTRVAVIDWRRQEAGTSAASTDQSDSVSWDIDQQRSVNAVQRAVANDTQSGSSLAFATSASAQAAMSVNTLFAGANASASTTTTGALTAQSSAGTRNLAAASTNAISARTAEKAQSLRSRRQSVVREVSQHESEQMSTRILANYNRRHSLNIEYFEVLQQYTLETKLVGWERCLFVPMKPLDFSKLETLKKHRADLLAIVAQLGTSDLTRELMVAIANIPKAEEQQKELDRLKENLKILADASQKVQEIAASEKVAATQLAHGIGGWELGIGKPRADYNALATRIPNVAPQISTNIYERISEAQLQSTDRRPCPREGKTSGRISP
jgi:hypothetical protein